MPPGLPEYALIIGGLLVAMFVGFVIAALLCASDSDEDCPGRVVEDVNDGQLYDWADRPEGLTFMAGPWECPHRLPCPIHNPERTR